MTKLLQKVGRNEAGNDYIVGDIHGMYNLLCKTLIEMEFDVKKDRLFSVGDLVDRGDQNMEVLRFLQRKPWFYSVMGNHESMMLDFICPGMGSNGSVWKRNGGDWYDDLTDSEKEELETILVPWLYETLPLVIEIDHESGPVYISHATPLSEYTETKIKANAEALIWDRSTLYWAKGKSQSNKAQNRFEHKSYCGHTPLKSVFTCGNATWLDTGAFATNNLTILKVGA